MKNPEEAVDRVLAGLRDAEAPAGMERRILDGLEERAAVRARSGWRLWLVMPSGLIVTRALMGGVALAGVFVLAFAIPAIRRIGQAPVHSRKEFAPVGSVRATSPVMEVKDAEPSSGGSRVRSRMTTNAPEAGLVRVADSEDAVALSEMQAASYPAPPMPLTEQERLLLRLVHKDDPVELALLDSKVRDLEDLKDKAEFQRFFGQPTKQTSPEQPVTVQAPPQPATTEQATPAQSTTEQATPMQPGTEPSAPEQSVPKQPVPDQPTQQQATPEKFAPDQSTTQQATPR